LKEKNHLLLKRIKGSLFIVSAPSGAGKTTLCKSLVESFPNLTFSVSYTTRRPRSAEVNDRDYSFIGKEDFKMMVEKGEFIEWAEVHGELYGTSRKRLLTLIEQGNDVILDIDTQGAMQLKEKGTEGIFIFILPPSLEILRKRLEQRMTDSIEEIQKRIDKSVSEIMTYPKYDYVIINDNLKDALKKFEAIIISHRLTINEIDPHWIEETFLKQEAK
jgi:guanylate kinase